MIPTKPLVERVKILTEMDWEEIQSLAYAMVMANERLDFPTAESFAMLSVIELREAARPLQVH